MKIDFYISSLSGGGAEKVLVTLAEAFSKKDHNISICSLEKRPQFYNVSNEIFLEKICNKGKFAFIKDFYSIRKRIKSRTSDVIVSFLSRCNLMVLLASVFSNKKIVVCDRNNPLKEHSKIIFKLSCQIYRLADCVIVQTEQIKSYYPKYLQNKVKVLENPMDFQKLMKQCEKQEIKKENTIISIGRLEPQKDFSTLIKAFSKVAEKYPEWKVKIFGKGDMRDQLQNEIDSFNLHEKILLCGRTEAPFLELKKSKIFVLSSNYEGFPNALCEGMFAKLPCIASDCVSGPRELIDRGKNGFLFEVGNINELAEKLDILLANVDLREKMGKKANATVQRLELSHICSKWEEIVIDVFKS